MSSQPLTRESLVISIPSRHRRYLDKVRGSDNAVFQYDIQTGEMIPWKWWVLSPQKFEMSDAQCRPVSLREGDRVVPSSLRKHRLTNRFLGPCCLCPLLERNGPPVFTEAAMYLATSGPFHGQYIARCAHGVCGYIGQSPSNEREYTRLTNLTSSPRACLPTYWLSSAYVRASW